MARLQIFRETGTIVVALALALAMALGTAGCDLAEPAPPPPEASPEVTGGPAADALLAAVMDAVTALQQAHPGLTSEEDDRYGPDEYDGEVGDLFREHGFEGGRIAWIADTTGAAVGVQADVFADHEAALAVDAEFDELFPTDDPVDLPGWSEPGRLRTEEDPQTISSSFVHGSAWISVYVEAAAFESRESAAERLSEDMNIARDALDAAVPVS